MLVKLEMYMEIDDKSLDEIRKIEHHVDWFADLESYPEIKSVERVAVTEVVSTTPEEEILRYLEYSYIGAKAMHDVTTMMRIDKAITAFQDDAPEMK